MGLNIKNPEVERLAAEVAEVMETNKTDAIRQALLEKQQRLAQEGRLTRKQRIRAALEEVWASLPPDQLGKPITKAEREEILGYGPHGV